jgi:hypothetical protein
MVTLGKELVELCVNCLKVGGVKLLCESVPAVIADHNNGVEAGRQVLGV